VATPRAPAEPQPQVVASTAAAQPTEMVVPLAPVKSEPVPTPVEAQPPVTSAAPVAQPAPLAAPIPKAPPPPKDLPSSAVRYLVEPPHTYPRVSRELGETGVVKLRLLIDEQGRLKHIQVTQSSGYPRLDQQAVTSMRQARFQPLIDNGVPREVTTTASIVFSLEEQ
jgi:protein TonB